ncbi:MAG: Gfo/Idh/MocA family oxidoreductase [Ruminococcaceae bacterium]|nr:Gfo/Idh/MocA family oxidoreductase [Oscillospiraceae bacterium]
MVKVCIVGAGRISELHAAAYKNNKSAELCAVCDINEERANAFADKFGIKNIYTSFEEMLEKEKDLDALDVCVWNKEHASKSVAALERGLNVLCEKPMAISLAEAERMTEAAKKNGKLLMIAQVKRFSNECAVARDMIESGALGSIYHSRAFYLRRCGNPGGWFADKSLSGGGPVIDIGIHNLDLCRYLMGCPKATSVYAITHRNSVRRSKNDACTVEDYAAAIIKYENGATTLFETSYNLNGRNDLRSAEVYGSEGGIIIDDKVTLYNQVGGHMMTSSLADVSLDKLDAQKANVNFQNEINHFIDCIENNTPCISDGEDSLENMRIIDALYRSAESGCEIIL